MVERPTSCWQDNTVWESPSFSVTDNVYLLVAHYWHSTKRGDFMALDQFTDMRVVFRDKIRKWSSCINIIFIRTSKENNKIKIFSLLYVLGIFSVFQYSIHTEPESIIKARTLGLLPHVQHQYKPAFSIQIPRIITDAAWFFLTTKRFTITPGY